MNFRKIALLLAFALLAGNACAFVSVTMKPLDGDGVLELYPYEVGRFVTIVKNDSNEAVEKVSLKWEADEGLAILESTQGFQASSSRVASVEDILPGEERALELKVKPVSLKKGAGGTTLKIAVSYGTESLDYYAGTHVKVVNPTLEIDAILSDRVISPGSENSVRLSVKNNSQHDIKISGARLLLPDYLYADANSKLSERALAPQEEIVNKHFNFRSDQSFLGHGKLILKIVFEDSRGLHEIDRDFSIESRGLDLGLISLILIVVVLIVAVVLSKRKKGAKKPHAAKSKDLTAMTVEEH